MKEIAETQAQPIGSSLDEQRREFARGRFLAMPLAGLIAWTIIGVSGALLPPFPAVMVLFGGAGSIVYLGMFISRFTGEHFLDRSKPKNSFDRMFFYTIVMALLVFAIAIPFFQADYTSLPLSVGILTGLMWVPFSWIIEHWIGIFHGIARTLLVTAAWYLAPDLRFVLIPNDAQVRCRGRPGSAGVVGRQGGPNTSRGF
jgi:hypothetical protein